MHWSLRSFRVLLLTCGPCLLVVGCCEPAARQAAQIDEAPAPRTLTFLTYNVLVDDVGGVERTRALLTIIERSQADVVALQEAAPPFLDALHNEPWVRASYSGTKIDGRIAAPGGQYILSKLPMDRAFYRVLPGPQRRTVLVVRLQVGPRHLMVATTHMESYLQDGPVRAQQLDAIFPLLGEADDALVLGDFNFGDGEPEEARILSVYVDLWRALRPNEAGFTWNMEQSPMARRGSFEGEKSRRIDRILIKSSVWAPASIAIVGDTPISTDGQIYPSDHYGLVGSVTIGSVGRSP